MKEEKITSPESIEASQNMMAIRSDPSFVAFEPALLLRAGARDIKFEAGLSMCNYNASGPYYRHDLAESLNAHIGFSINIKPRKK